MRWGWKPYVPVAKRRAQAQKRAKSMTQKGDALQPVTIEGRTIATTFWGKAWCENLEGYSDYENRLPRGRTYVRNGSVLDLRISAGRIKALVSGSELYKVNIDITPVSAANWERLRRDCSQSVDSLMDLLQGRFSQGVMERLTRQKEGLFPQPREIKLDCSCPDYATMCKHAAAVLYGVGARLDDDPVLLFLLRQVDHVELIREAVDGANLDAALAGNNDDSLAGEDLGALFGIDLSTPDAVSQPNPRAAGGKKTAARKRTPAVASAPQAPAPRKTRGTIKKAVKAAAKPTGKASATPTVKSRPASQPARAEQPAEQPPARNRAVRKKVAAVPGR